MADSKDARCLSLKSHARLLSRSERSSAKGTNLAVGQPEAERPRRAGVRSQPSEMRLDRINPPPPGFQERLLKTAAADVPPPVHDAARDFCDAMREVEAGWVCRVERRQPGGEAEERPALAVKLRGRIE